MKSFKNIPKMLPLSNNKKFKKIQSQRRQQLKSVIQDVTGIAKKELERFNDFTVEMLSEEMDNPIILEDSQDEQDDENGISI